MGLVRLGNEIFLSTEILIKLFLEGTTWKILKYEIRYKSGSADSLKDVIYFKCTIQSNRCEINIKQQ